jgi:hypothetical protein
MAAWVVIPTTVANAASHIFTALTTNGVGPPTDAGADAWDIVDAGNKVAKCPAAANANNIDVLVKINGCEGQQYLVTEMGDAWSGSAWTHECREIADGSTRPKVFSNPDEVDNSDVINVWMRVVRGAGGPAYIIIVAEGDIAVSGVCSVGFYGSYTMLDAADTTGMMGAVFNTSSAVTTGVHVYQTELGSHYWDSSSNVCATLRPTVIPTGNPSDYDGDWWLYPIGVFDRQTSGDFRGTLPGIYVLGDGGWAHKDTLTDDVTADTYMLVEGQNAECQLAVASS